MHLPSAPPQGKRSRQAELALPRLPPSIGLAAAAFPAAVSPPAAGLLRLLDDFSGLEFLVDTGACVSLFPHVSAEASSPDRRLRTADGSPLPTYGSRLLRLSFAGRRFAWRFLLAPVQFPILGWDFLSHHRLLVDTDGRRLLHTSTAAPLYTAVVSAVDSTLSSACNVDVSTLDVHPSVRWLLQDFSAIFGKGFSDLKPSHGVTHHIVTKGPPVHAKARRLDPEKLAAAKEEFRRMEQAGVIRRSNSPWASPLHMVGKPDGSWRPCGDYRTLNNVTVPDRYPVPHVQDFTARLHGCTVFTKLDLVKGYYQVPMHPADIPKTCVITPFGAWEWLFMPFGLRNAGNTFQRMIDRVADGFEFCFIYLDDVLVASRDLPQHLVHLRRVLERLRDFGLVINPAKCDFAAGSVSFLGHQVSAAGIAPLARHVDAVAAFPPPVDRPGLQRFLGLINYFRRFLPAAAGFLRPLTDALRGPASSFAWTPEMSAAFSRAKSALSAAARLQHPAPNARISLAVDASDRHVGGVLQQWSRGAWAPLAFYSKKLLPAEERYSTFDRELLAAFSAVRHFRFMLEGRPFTLFTDHRPLAAAVLRTSPPVSARQQRQLSFLSEFSCEVVYLPGAANAAADAMSRPAAAVAGAPPVPGVSLPAELPAARVPVGGELRMGPSPETGPLRGVVAPATASADGGCLPAAPAFHQLQQADPDCLRLAADARFAVRLTGGVWASHAGPTPRVLVPADLRRRVFNDLHALSHPGIRATRRLAARAFLWTGMNKDITAWASSCLACQAAKVTRHQRAPVHEIPIPVRRFSHVHVDLVGPLKPSGGCSYLLTVVDRSTRWPEAVPLADITAETVVRAFSSSWVARFGCPSTLTTDQGAQFMSGAWKDFCQSLGISHVTTTAFHPQSNGMVERFHRRLKAALRARAAHHDWISHLPFVLLGLRSTPMEESDVSSAEYVYGAALSLPSSFLDGRPPPDDRFLSRLQAVMSRLVPPPTNPDPGPSFLDPRLHSAEHVFVRRDGHVPPLEPLYHGPYKVLSAGEKVFLVSVGGKPVSISVDRLKPVISDVPVKPAVPPRRGRPPRPRPAPSSPPRRRGRPPASHRSSTSTSRRSSTPPPRPRRACRRD